jgi:hypothetical protein
MGVIHPDVSGDRYLLARTLNEVAPIPFGVDIWYGATPPGAEVLYMPTVEISHTPEQRNVKLPRVFGTNHPLVVPLRMVLDGYPYDAAFFVIAHEESYPGATPAAIGRGLARQVQIWCHPDKEKCDHEDGRCFLMAVEALKTALTHIEEVIVFEMLGSTCRRNAKALFEDFNGFMTAACYKARQRQITEERLYSASALYADEGLSDTMKRSIPVPYPCVYTVNRPYGRFALEARPEPGPPPPPAGGPQTGAAAPPPPPAGGPGASRAKAAPPPPPPPASDSSAYQDSDAQRRAMLERLQQERERQQESPPPHRWKFKLL